MRLHGLVLILLLSLSRPGVAQSLPRPQDRLHEDVRASLVYITATAETIDGDLLNASATGAVITPDGHVVTVYHLLTGLKKDVQLKEDSIKFSGSLTRKHGNQEPLTIIDGDPQRDLLLLRFESRLEGFSYLCTDPSLLKNSQQLFTSGFPEEIPYRVGSGEVLSPDGENDTIVIDIPIDEGQSGSPIYLENGRLVGIALGKVKNLEQAYSMVGIEYVKRLKPSLPANCEDKNDTEEGEHRARMHGGENARAVERLMSHEIKSLIAFYENRAQDVEQDMAAALKEWRRKREADRLNPVWEASIEALTLKRERFKQLHERHIAALKAGQLTLAQIHANTINEFLLGARLAYATPPGVMEFTSTAFFDNRKLGLDLRGLADILSDSSRPSDERVSAAELIAQNCKPVNECIPGLAAVFELPESYYILWEYASYTLCKIGSAAQAATPSLVKVLANRTIYSDWRSWIFAMQTLACIDPPADVVPSIVEVLARPEVDPETYYNTPHIQSVAAHTLGTLGPRASDALTTLQKILNDSETEQDLRAAVSDAIKKIQGRAE